MGADEKTAQRIVDELFSTEVLKDARREQIISRIGAGDLLNPDESLIELFKKADRADMATALSYKGRKGKNGLPHDHAPEAISRRIALFGVRQSYRIHGSNRRSNGEETASWTRRALGLVWHST
jgi:hypothetical protein